VSLARFYARRSLRIFPAAYAYIAIVAALAWGGIVALHPHDLGFATTYTMSYALSPSWWLGHLWSLSVEEQFYLLWPGVLALGGRRHANGLIASWLLGSVTVATGLMHRILNNRPVVALGTVSYSLYLWQQLFIRLAESSGVGMPLTTLRRSCEHR
jgi:peptidoglycan/LPS O-acetylase OafA/YrhL